MDNESSELLTYPLHFLAGDKSINALNVAKILLTNGADPNYKNQDGLTPAHVAAAWGNYDFLQLLLRQNANPQILDNDGQSPLSLAEQEGHKRCVDLMKNFLGCFWYKNFDGDHNRRLSTSSSSSSAKNDTSVITKQSTTKNYEPRFFKSPFKQNTTKAMIDHNEQVFNLLKSRQQEQQHTSSSIVNVTKSSIYPSLSFSNGSEINQKLNLNHHSLTSSNRLSSSINDLRISTTVESSTSTADLAALCITDDKIQSQNNNSDVDVDFPTDSTVVTFQTCYSKLPTFFIAKKHTPPPRPPPPKLETIKKNRSKSDDGRCISTNRSNIIVVSSDDHVVNRPLSSPSVVDVLTTTTHTVINDHDHDDDGDELNLAAMETVRRLSDHELRRRLLDHGGNLLGPVNHATRIIYQRMLARYLTGVLQRETKRLECIDNKFSNELTRLVNNENLDVSEMERDDYELCKGFQNGDKNWREGCLKMSFCYLLIDPRKLEPDITDLVEDGKKHDLKFEKFLRSIFYIGKGKKSRPLQHLIDAGRVMNANETEKITRKLLKIVDLWKNDQGVVSLHIFHNITPTEAYTREAAMIDTMGLNNLTNVKRGDYYGDALNWNGVRRRRYGAYILYKAYCIYKLERTVPLKLTDVVFDATTSPTTATVVDL